MFLTPLATTAWATSRPSSRTPGSFCSALVSCFSISFFLPHVHFLFLFHHLFLYILLSLCFHLSSPPPPLKTIHLWLLFQIARFDSNVPYELSVTPVLQNTSFVFFFWVLLIQWRPDTSGSFTIEPGSAQMFLMIHQSPQFSHEWFKLST